MSAIRGEVGRRRKWQGEEEEVLYSSIWLGVGLLWWCLLLLWKSLCLVEFAWNNMCFPPWPRDSEGSGRCVRGGAGVGVHHCLRPLNSINTPYFYCGVIVLSSCCCQGCVRLCVCVFLSRPFCHFPLSSPTPTK